MQTSILKLFILGLGGKIKIPGCSGLSDGQQIQAFSRAFAEAVRAQDLLKHLHQIQASSRVSCCVRARSADTCVPDPSLFACF